MPFLQFVQSLIQVVWISLRNYILVFLFVCVVINVILKWQLVESLPAFSYTIVFFGTTIKIKIKGFMEYLKCSAKGKYLASLPTLNEEGFFNFISPMEGQVIALSFLCSFLLLMIVFILIVGFNNVFTKKAMFESLKKKKMVKSFFLLDKRIQRLIVIIIIGSAWLSFYFLISTNLFPTIWCKVLYWLSIKAFCTDQETSENPSSSKQSSCKNEENATAGKKSRSSAKASQSSTKREQSTKTEAFGSGKASPASSKGKGKEKMSTSSKKNKPSKKEKSIDAVKQTEQVTKTQASKAAKQSKESSSSGRPVRPEDLWGDDDHSLVSELKNAKMLSEKGKQATEDSVDYFPELENAKGVSKSQITDIEGGESSQAKPPQSKHKHIRHMEGKTASELGENFGRIKKDSYLFTHDNKTS